MGAHCTTVVVSRQPPPLLDAGQLGLYRHGMGIKPKAKPAQRRELLERIKSTS